MTDYQERVRIEKRQLDIRLEAFNEFKHSDLYAKLPINEQERLNTQGHLMCAYSAVLGARIAEFSAPEERSEQ